ncbi:hypothetical protein WJX73_004918 [Symbiochloris irregularis]|uniref:Uncharacterized protein n=1 Tax=Symbiochloris irregularis TaxID=706552 RepID=A0AAW1NX64_9CHLO
MLGSERPTGLAALFSYLLIGFVAASAVVGIGFVAFGFALQAPAKSFVPVCLVLIGILTLVASVFGYIGARFRPAYLLYYLIVAGVATFLQLVILLCIFFAENKVATAIQMESSTDASTRNYIVTQLTVGKWIFIWMCAGELIALGIALGMYLSGKVEGVYARMTPEEQHSQHTLELNSIKTGMGHSGQSTGNKLAARLQAKYGGSAMEDFMKGRRWYNWFG